MKTRKIIAQGWLAGIAAGELTPTRKISLSTSSVMAISEDGQYLFSIGPGGSADASVFQLLSNADPQLLGELDEYLDWKWSNCEFAASRSELSAVDVFCNGYAFSLEWRPDSRQLIQTDYLGLDELDRFGNIVPDFGDIRRTSVASPDGKHVYLSTRDGSLVIFERVGNSEGRLSTTPVLTSETGSLHLPMAEYRDGAGTLCFTAELRDATDSGNWMESGAWTLVAGATRSCGTSTEDIPYLEAATGVLQIPNGKILNEDGMNCFIAELQASEDYLDWTLLAGNYRDCQ